MPSRNNQQNATYTVYHRQFVQLSHFIAQMLQIFARNQIHTITFMHKCLLTMPGQHIPSSYHNMAQFAILDCCMYVQLLTMEPAEIWDTAHNSISI